MQKYNNLSPEGVVRYITTGELKSLYSRQTERRTPILYDYNRMNANHVKECHMLNNHCSLSMSAEHGSKAPSKLIATSVCEQNTCIIEEGRKTTYERNENTV